MDKQRLMELAGITEATYSGHQSGGYVVTFTNHADVGQLSNIWGPFSSHRQAMSFLVEYEDYLKSQMSEEEFNEIEEAEMIEVHQLEHPKEAFD